MHHGDYDTILVGMIDEYFGTIALESWDKILDRSRSITHGNPGILTHWVASEPLIFLNRRSDAGVGKPKCRRNTATARIVSALRNLGVTDKAFLQKNRELAFDGGLA